MTLLGADGHARARIDGMPKERGNAGDLGGRRPDLAAAAARLGKRLRDADELAPVAAYVGDRETVRFLAKGSLENSAGLVVLTDSRLLFFFSGVLHPGLDVPLSHVVSVTSSSGLSTGQLTIGVTDREKPLVLARIVKPDLAPLAHAVRQAVEAAPPEAPASGGASADPFVALERLAELRDRGVLTEAEFAAKKQELLDRL
jgi:hypothetical protein